MRKPQNAPALPGYQPGKKALLVFFETDCPTCQLTLPYFNTLAKDSVQVIAISQGNETRTREFARQMQINYRIERDQELRLSRAYDPQTVPALFLLDESGGVEQSLVGFGQPGLTDLAAPLGHSRLAPTDDPPP